MSIIYVPRLIETAEQAEALPVNTVAFYDETIHHSARYATTRVDGGWYDEHWQATGPMPHREVIGWTALVPIEAREEHDEDHYGAGPGEIRYRTTYTTPWEEA